MHKRVDRVEAVCAAALVERGQKGTGNAGERAVRKRERQRGVKDEPALFTAYARDAAAAAGDIIRIQPLPGGRLQVSSANESYLPFELDFGQIGQDVAIVGRVLWFGRQI